MILHLTSDEKFVESTVLEFEKHFPNKNIFVIDTIKKSDQLLKYVNIDNINKFAISLESQSAIREITALCNEKIECIFIHSYSLLKGYTALELCKKFNSKILWVCNGADLYGKLMIDGNYELFDLRSIRRRIRSFMGFYLKNSIYSLKLGANLFKYEKMFYKELDYFCTWNHYDYKLFNQHYVSNSKFISFHYPTSSVTDYIDNDLRCEKFSIMVNQSASKSGNHLTILNKLLNIDKNKSIRKLVVPLSYGPYEIKKEVLDYGNKNLAYCFTPLEKFLNKEEFFAILKEVKCAVFGHRRQEAANNIFFLLGFGAKVFLRKDNNLLKYFKEKGFYIYEYESDLLSLRDLEGLTEFEQNENKRLLLKEMAEEKVYLEYNKIAEIIKYNL